MDRAFQGIKNLYGQKGFEKIQSAHFLVIGIGGVGSWICESLIRSGVTNLTVVDLDDICISNLNRQIHTLHNNIGKLKVEAMQERLVAINPNANIVCIEEFFSESTMNTILEKKYDFVFDAIDSVKSKCLLLDQCRRRNQPVICIGGSGGKTNPTKIMVNDLLRSINDPLLAQIRKKLRQDFSFSKFANKPFKIPAVFSSELPNNSLNISCSHLGPINCQTHLGSASFLTASFGMTAVSFVLNKIADYHERSD